MDVGAVAILGHNAGVYLGDEVSGFLRTVQNRCRQSNNSVTLGDTLCAKLRSGFETEAVSVVATSQPRSVR